MKSKGNSRSIWLIGLIVLLSLSFTACTVDTECRQDSIIKLNVVFTGDSLRPSTDSIRLSIDSLAMDTIPFSTVTGLQIHGLGRDSILYTGEAAISKAKLPLRPDSLHTEFVLTFQGQSDTISILHQNDMQFISLACGCFVYHTIDAVKGSHLFIDSVNILNSQVTTATDDHIRIFFHTW